MNAFKDGEIAHFFFVLTGYVKTDKVGSSRILLNDKVDFKGRSSYAHISGDLGFDAAESDDTLAFQSILDHAYAPSEWRTRSLGSSPLDVTYEIVSFRVTGLFRESTSQLDLITPIRRVVGGNVYALYELESRSTYHLRVVTHLPYRSPAALPGQGQVKLRLNFDSELIKPLGSTSLRITSFYDLEYWSFVVSGAEPQQSALRIECDYNAVVDRSEFQRTEVLCPEMSLPISIVSGKLSGQASAQ